MTKLKSSKKVDEEINKCWFENDLDDEEFENLLAGWREAEILDWIFRRRKQTDLMTEINKLTLGFSKYGNQAGKKRN